LSMDRSTSTKLP